MAVFDYYNLVGSKNSNINYDIAKNPLANDAYTGTYSEEKIEGDKIVKSGKALSNVWINNWIKSSNYQPKSSGFFLDSKDGTIDCKKITPGKVVFESAAYTSASTIDEIGLTNLIEWRERDKILAFLGGVTEPGVWGTWMQTYNSGSITNLAYFAMMQYAGTSAIAFQTNSSDLSGYASLVLSDISHDWTGTGIPSYKSAVAIGGITGGDYSGILLGGHTIPLHNQAIYLGNVNYRFLQVCSTYATTHVLRLTNFSDNPSSANVGDVVCVLGVIKVCTNNAPVTWTVVGSQT